MLSAHTRKQDKEGDRTQEQRLFTARSVLMVSRACAYECPCGRDECLVTQLKAEVEQLLSPEAFPTGARGGGRGALPGRFRWP